MPRRRDERAAMLTAIGFGLGGGLLLASPVADYLSSPQVSERHQLVNPFSSWNSLSDADVVILGTDVGGGNTDVMYTMRVQNGVTKLLQVPRDTYINSSSFGPVKANALYAYGGPDAVKAELSKHLGRPVRHHILVNLAVIRRLGDALGGLEVNVPKRMWYHDNTQGLHIDLQPGRQVLKGRDLEGFLRFRHDEMGDIGRLDRQRLVLKALFKQITRPESLVRLPALLAVAGKDLRTDLGPMEIGGLISAMGSTELNAERLGGRPFMHEGISYWKAEWPEATAAGAAAAGSSERFKFLF
ncbi:MAG: LCP family protein [Cyanobacteria bacterium]|jgi:LCP family protein required for cell wall assembly|uniref:LCP family protein n=1 Tax=Synechococcaceae TaxID=1890426 RepID=UPI000D7ACBB5|nr:MULTISPECIES: LCP family protein [Synechococcaceae]MDA0727316.1 LCP family protein [Cyanobacteriota bacterium]NCV92370.1 LytR family transcriptional regulator [Synechococcaceae bacterium WB7_3xG_012]PWL23881.1 MAG: transcriptional regulator [Synechococcus sp. XM-24]MDA0963937.1 LCP family protein [Cyanobacteriota bacterium]MDA1157593.1 LCP family protein [Cyanobacteriota bacterium]